MSLKIVFSTLVLLVAVSLPFAASLKCYTCNSLENSENECQMLKNMEPTECSQQVLSNIAQVKFPNEIRRIFEFDNGSPNMPNPEWSCAKLEIAGMHGKTNYTIRTCQIAKTDMANFCNTAMNKLKSDSNTNNNYQPYNVQHCSECQKDACNGASSITISLPILAVLLLASYIKA